MEDPNVPNSSHDDASPKCVTYSVSFCDKLAECDKLNEQSDTTRLLEADEDADVVDVLEVPAVVVSSQGQKERSNCIDVPGTNQTRQELYSTSVPGVSANDYFRPAQGYGSLPFPSSLPADGLSPRAQSAGPRRVIYCVHGNLTGCCTMRADGLGEGLLGGAAATPTAPGAPAGDKEPPTLISGEHCHRIRDEKVDQRARRKLILASILCVVFMIGEIIGGVLSSSLAIATDAAHLLTDFASFMISLFSLWVASRPPTRRMSFGWYRAEVIGALTSVLMIWVVTGVLVYLAIERIVEKNFDIDARIMLITSAIGVLVNLVMGFTLHQHGHGHSHSHSDSAAESGHHGTPSDTQNINVRAAYIHVIGDFLQSFGVFIAALVIYFQPSWIIVDPICTFLFSILVIFTTFAIIKDTLMVLMEGMPKGIDFTAVMNTFLQIDGVIKVHNLRIWALSLDKTALAAHLAIRPGVSPQEVLTLASRNIHDRFNFFEMTLQIEEFDQNMEDCTQCKCPES